MEVSPTPMPPNDLVESLPAPVLRLLILLSGPIAAARSLVEVLFWTSERRVQSWMVLIGWWAVCLSSTYTFRYLIPPLLFLPLLQMTSLQLTQNATAKHDVRYPATSDTVLSSLADLYRIHALLPASTPAISSFYGRMRQLGPKRLCRGLILLWSIWVLLGRIVGLCTLLAIAGSIIILLPSPPFAQLSHVLSRSLLLRRAVFLSFLLVFGSPPDHSYNFIIDFSISGWLKTKWATSRRPSLALSFKPQMKHEMITESVIEEDAGEDREGSAVFFRFEIQENQRWWMGLDWTSALLPQERPSWCDSHLRPMPPPSSFSLPPSASIILPFSSKIHPDAKQKRTATWAWIDDDWSVARTASSISPNLAQTESDTDPGAAPLGGLHTRTLSSSIGISPPVSTQGFMSAEESMTAGARAHAIAEQAFTKGLERLKAKTASPSGLQAAASTGKMSEVRRARNGSQTSDEFKEESHDILGTTPESDGITDQEGWVYGDNKWENMGPKGGLGKFTRRRRWQRRAVCTEHVERVSRTAGHPASGVMAEFPRDKHASPSLSETVRSPDTRPRASLEADLDRSAVMGTIAPGNAGLRDDQLRLRLKKAMGSVGG